MQISSVFSASQAYNLNMSERQRTAQEEIMAKYDPAKMTDEDMAALQTELREAGIPNSTQSASLLKAAGFEVEYPGRSQSVKDAQTESQQKSLATLLNNEESEKGKFWEVYQQYASGNITEEEFLEKMKAQTSSGSIINYTS